MSMLQEKSSALKREHQVLQKMKFIIFYLCLSVIFALPDPDCESGSGYGSRDPIESGSSAMLVSTVGTIVTRRTIFYHASKICLKVSRYSYNGSNLKRTSPSVITVLLLYKSTVLRKNWPKKNTRTFVCRVLPQVIFLNIISLCDRR